MRITFTGKEIKEIVIATAVLSVAFGIAFSGGLAGLSASTGLASLSVSILFSFIAVGIGFIAHELIGHKFIAQRFNFHAEFRMWPFGLAIAIIFSFGGFVFAAPGAVVIQQRYDLWGRASAITKKSMGLIAIAGPAVNIVLAFVFFLLSVIVPVGIGGIELFALATRINIWLAIFNMLPIPPLDGSKVFAWDKKIWIGFFALCIALFVLL